MDITVNLASRPFIDLRPALRWLRGGVRSLAVLVVLLGTITFVVHRKAEGARSRVRAIQGKIISIHNERKAYQEMLRHSESVQIRRRADDLNRIFEAKAFSWTEVMKDLESEMPDQLQVTAIEPAKSKDGSTTLHVRVLGPRNKGIEFVRNLEASSHFLYPRIIGEAPDTRGAPGVHLSGAAPSKTTELDVLTAYDPDASQLSGDHSTEQKEAHRAAVAKNVASSPTTSRTGPPGAATGAGGTK